MKSGLHLEIRTSSRNPDLIKKSGLNQEIWTLSRNPDFIKKSVLHQEIRTFEALMPSRDSSVRANGLKFLNEKLDSSF